MVTKVIILAGGKGTRLSPLTNNLPKPLLPINNIPTLSHVLRSVEKAGFRNATLTLGYQKEAIIKRYGGFFRTLRLDYAVEETPLGTAGAVKAAAHPAGPVSDPDREGDILVLSGDAYFEGDLSELIKTHETTRADLTIAAKEVDDVTGYGVIVGEGNRIRRFAEKPDPQNAPSHLVNIGMYLLSHRVLSEIPDGQYDFGKQLFPSLLQKGYHLAYHTYEDYWCDIGTPQSYLSCNLATAQSEAVIGAHCQIEKSATIEQSVLLEEVTVMENCRIRHSILAKGVMLEEGVCLNHCVVGENCRLHDSPPAFSRIFLHDGTLTVTPLPQPTALTVR